MPNDTDPAYGAMLIDVELQRQRRNKMGIPPKTKYEKVREGIDQIIGECLANIGCDFSCIRAETKAIEAKEKAVDQILSLADILVKDGNQDLPKEPEFYQDWGGQSGRQGYISGQQDMLSNNWVKVLKK